ncbi:MAG: hypothetical protein WC661_18775 [Opitutaceae bacterium]|jgi:hypothetical protein
MTISRCSVAHACVALLDYALVALLAYVGSLWWIAARLAFNPDPESIARDYTGLMVVATGLALVLVFRAPKWRLWRMAAVVAFGAVGWLFTRGLELEAANAGAASGETHLLIVQGGAFLLVVVALFALRRHALARGWLSTGSRVAFAVVLAGYLFYLGHDEAPAPSIARNHAAMAGRSEDEATYRLTLRYTPAPGGGRIFTAPKNQLGFPARGEKRIAYLRAHRAEIEANRAELAEVRAWWAEMAAQPQLGDRPGTSFDQPFIRFQPVRIYSQYALALAELHALDGDGDGALAAAGDVYAVGVRLEASSCTLVRSMIALVTQKQALETAEFVLDHARVSPAAKARFAGLLSEGKADGAGAKRLMLADVSNYYGTAEAMSRLKGIYGGRSDESVAMRLIKSASGLLYFTTLNPQATANRRHDFFEKLAARAEARDLAGMKKMSDDLSADQLGGFQVKNLSGRLLVRMSSPAFEKIAQNYWETEDRRTALVRRLQESPPAS